jgi:23S rRNA (adenine2503-C2)-methyltransferase
LWWAVKELGGFSGELERPISNVVMMGMGEPLLNFEPVMEAVNLMMEDCAYGLSKRKVTVSTSGVVPAIDRMKEFTEASLAISLHAPNDELRSQIMPINKKYNIAMLLESVRGYMASLPDKRVPVIEYTMIAGVNDHRQHARELAELLKTFPCKINIIPFNPFSLSDYRRPSGSSVTNFRQILQREGYTVTVRTTRGDDIGAACGQLVGEVADQTKRSQRHKAKAESNRKVFDRADNLAVTADRL